ncbi:rhodanese-like domain-containing protein [Salisediminibacterium selenitireducens]|uniref:Rhodanese domain protein n=1 Tax=Bacillus selenitireducens (strain ATCC 700615 / DSM 15326 / MLS10) TaxID=439292 RepID=D6XWP5_BACIE|nr:rhodanese-like domain-containing protein [Salisediminibacterium selenitireducens]ADH97887.1 Rhodanese domain protein [[Bacillus] selenitireducens MLS10]
MKQLLIVLSGLFLLGACGGTADLDGLNTMTATDLEAQTEQGLEDDVQYIDVRETDEFDEESIPGFENMPMALVMDNPSLLNEEEDVVILCNTQNRSKEVAEALIDAGFDHDRVIVVEGGISDYNGTVN